MGRVHLDAGGESFKIIIKPIRSQMTFFIITMYKLFSTVQWRNIFPHLGETTPTLWFSWMPQCLGLISGNGMTLKENSAGTLRMAEQRDGKTLVFKKLLQYNSYITYHFKHTIQWHWIHSQCWATITTIHFQNFIIPNINLYTHKTWFLFFTSPQPLVTSVFLYEFTTLGTSCK